MNLIWTKHIKQVVDYLPAITLVYFTLAYVYLYSYYLPFDIEVTDYYDYGEILFPTIIPLLLIFLLFVVIQVVRTFNIMTNEEIPAALQAIQEKINSTDGATSDAGKKRKAGIQRLQTSYKYIGIFYKFTIGGLLTMFFVASLMLAVIVTYKTGRITISLLPFIYIGIYSIAQTKLVAGFSDKMIILLKRVFILITITLLIIGIAMMQYYKGKLLIDKGARYVLTGKLNDKIFTSDQNHLLYIGTSKDYYLSYSTKENSALTIQRSNLDSVSVKKIREFSIEDFFKSGFDVK